MARIVPIQLSSDLFCRSFSIISSFNFTRKLYAYCQCTAAKQRVASSRWEIGNVRWKSWTPILLSISLIRNFFLTNRYRILFTCLCSSILLSQKMPPCRKFSLLIHFLIIVHITNTIVFYWWNRALFIIEKKESKEVYSLYYLISKFQGVSILFSFDTLHHPVCSKYLKKCNFSWAMSLNSNRVVIIVCPK